MSKEDVCGADASAKFSHDDFGIDFGREAGFNMEVNLRIQVEGVKSRGQVG